MSERLLQAWRQSEVPVIFRPSEANVLIKLPFSVDNRAWLSRGRQRRADWNPKFKCWELPRSAFNELARRIIDRYAQVILIQPYNPEQKCCHACQNAKGLDCECACMGKNHGQGCTDDPWYKITGAMRDSFEGREYQIQSVGRHG